VRSLVGNYVTTHTHCQSMTYFLHWLAGRCGDH